MAKLWALLDADARVVEIISLADGVTPGRDVFSPDWNFVQAGPNVSAGQVYADGQFSTITPAPPIPLTLYAERVRDVRLTEGATFNVAPSVQILSDGTNSTRADLGLLALYGQANPAGTKTWVDNNGKVTVLTGAQLVTLTELVGAWVSDMYAAYGEILSGLASGSITTAAQIDNYAWPTV